MLANAQRDLTAEQAAARQGIRKTYFLKFKLAILYPQAEGTLRHCALQGQKVGTTEKVDTSPKSRLFRKHTHSTATAKTCQNKSPPSS